MPAYYQARTPEAKIAAAYEDFVSAVVQWLGHTATNDPEMLIVKSRFYAKTRHTDTAFKEYGEDHLRRLAELHDILVKHPSLVPAYRQLVVRVLQEATKPLTAGLAAEEITLV